MFRIVAARPELFLKGFKKEERRKINGRAKGRAEGRAEAPSRRGGLFRRMGEIRVDLRERPRCVRRGSQGRLRAALNLSFVPAKPKKPSERILD